MIIAIRERLFKNRNTLTYIIFGIIGLAFIMPSFVRQVSLYGDWFARVNGQEIGYHDYVRKTNYFEQQIQMIRQYYGQYADIFLKSMGFTDYKELAIKSLIDEELLNQSARAIGIYPDHACVQDKISSMTFVQQVMPDLIPMYVFDQSTQSINEERLSAYLRRTRMSVSTFEYKIQEALARMTTAGLLAAATYIPDFELLQEFEATHQLRKYSILTIPFSRILAEEKTKPLSDEDIRDYYDRHKDEYRVPEKRAGKTWIFKPEAYGIQVTDQDIDVYYDTHKTQKFIEKPAQVEVRHILLAVGQEADVESIEAEAHALRNELTLDPAKFAAKAKERSDDKDSASSGGLLKPFAKGTHYASFDKAAFLLPEAGAISEIVRTDKGFEIIQLVGKTQVTFKPLAAVAKEIRSILLKQQFGQAFAEDVNNLKERGDEALQEFIRTKGASLGVTYTNQERGSDKAVQALFVLEKMGDFTALVEKDNGMIVQLTSVTLRMLPELETIKDDVTSDVYDVRAQERIKVLLEEARAQAMTRPLSEIAASVGATYQATDFIGSDALDDKKQPLKHIISPKLHKAMTKLEKAGLMTIYTTERDGYLMRCDEVAPLDQAAFQSEKARMRKDLDQQRAGTLTNGFIASLYRNATIEFNKQSTNE